MISKRERFLVKMLQLCFLCTQTIATMHNASDEIDLLELVSKMFNSIKKNLALLTVSFIVGSGIGLGFYSLVPNVYESEMIITSDILTESYSKSVFANIQKLIKEDNITSLSSLLRITESQAAAIDYIELKGTIEEADALQEQNKTYINIIVTSSDNTIWPNLQAGIAAFIENNAFVKIRVQQKKKYLTSLITKLDHELKDLEIMKAKIMEGQLSSNGKDGMLLLDPTTINTKIIELSKEKLKAQDSLELSDSVQVVEGFTSFQKPKSPKLHPALLGGAAFALFIAFAFIGIRSIEKHLKVQAQENNV